MAFGQEQRADTNLGPTYNKSCFSYRDLGGHLWLQ